jgi:predicted RNA-binding Zn ribbon-like protein
MIDTEFDTERFSFIGGQLSLDFTNTISNYTADRGGERFGSYTDLVAWARAAKLLNADEAGDLLRIAGLKPDAAEATFNEARDLREALHFIFYAQSSGSLPREGDLATLNEVLGRAMCHARLAYGEQDREFKWDWDTGGDLDRMLWPVARSAADLLTSGDVERVRHCAGDDCGWLFLDMSRNHSRHWCDMRDCGNRAKARRHYHRKRVESAE